MAERRMFAKTIVLSDAFLDMPMSARCLYFTLGMFADDDGFVNSPKSIMRQCGASQDDMQILIAKKFLLTFDSGVIVIKHWRINNYLRQDRHNDTKYTEEMSQLTVSENGAYTLGIPSANQVPTNCLPGGIPSIDKDSIDKISIDKSREDDDITAPPSTVDQVVNAWNQIPHTQDVSGIYPGTRRWDELQFCLHKYGAEYVLRGIEKIANSAYLKKRGNVRFDNYVTVDQLQKVMEGAYDVDYTAPKPIDYDNIEWS